MDRIRRGFVAAAAALAAAPLEGCGGGAKLRTWDGREAITKAEWDALMTRLNGRFTCVRTPEANEGPFYYESSLGRRTITEGRKGVALRLGIRIANAIQPGDSCSALAGAVVDVWQADADGLYSNVGGDLQTVDTTGQTFMRGNQITDADGYVEFDTVVPGWELVAVPGPSNAILRTSHIHVKVFHEHQITTTVLYFPDALLDELYASVEPYTTHRQMTAPGVGRRFDRIRNGQDTIFTGDQSAPLPIDRRGDLVLAQATIGLVSMGTRDGPSLFR